MTNEEAIETLKRNYPSECFEQLREAVDMAISALEKQIPMKSGMKKLIGKLGNNNVYVIPCGNCGSSIKITHLFCPWCGQAIDWSDVEG